MRTAQALFAGAAVFLGVLSPEAASAQGVAFKGRLIDSVSAMTVGGATVRIDELRRETVTAEDGTFTFENVAPGVYHLSVRLEGFSSRRSEITVANTSAAQVDVMVDPDLRYHETVSVSPEPRSQFEAYQPTSVLAGQELGKQLQMSLGATLENQPGVAARSFGPAPSRPVVRGLDGDRVQILQDGQRMGDLSSQSGDHGVAINPAAAKRIEVVRGPATLLYGANAIGGLVNVITEDIPTRPIESLSGNATFDLGSAADEGGGAASLLAGNGRFAVTLGAGGRRSGDVATRQGDLLNSQSRNGFVTIGTAWTGTRGSLGASYGYEDTKYGIPVVEEGSLQLTPRRHQVTLRGGAQDLSGTFESFRSTLAIRRYKHEELEGDEIGTAFSNNTTDLEVLGSHRPYGRLKGSVGAWFMGRAFDAVGAEALSPAVDQNATALFAYEELTWPHVTVQFGGRFDHARYFPFEEAERSFNTGSGSAGLLFRPAAARDAVTFVVSLARAARYPALEELFFYGPHPGNFAFEIGNPGLRPEHALGFDGGLRWRSARTSGEITYFRNEIRDYVFRSPLTEEEFEAREDEFAARFPGRGIQEEGEGGHDHGEFPFVEYVSADSVLQGIEAHSDFQLTPRFAAEVGFDYVRGRLKDTADPLPRIPPLRFRGGLRFVRNAFQAGGDVTVAAAQDRVFGAETPTDGYQLLRLFGAYSFGSGQSVSTITVRFDNATNELYRNHLSYLKDLAPEMGRNLKVLYNVRF
jgi:iron complex outermembrane receptor protein